MAETAGKRFYISEKSAKNEIYSCPPLETLPSRNIPVDCFCERRPKSLISRRGTQAKRALNIVGIDKQNTGLIHVKNLFPYFLNPLFPLPKWQHAQNPCPIRLSAGGGGAKSAPHNTFRRTKSALTLRTNAKAQRLLFRHTATNIFANCQNRHLAVSQIKFNTS